MRRDLFFSIPDPKLFDSASLVPSIARPVIFNINIAAFGIRPIKVLRIFPGFCRYLGKKQ